MHLADEMGVRPEVDRCVECDRMLEPDEQFSWVPPLGGVLCSRCPGPPEQRTGLSVDALKLLKAYQKMDVEALAGLRLQAAVEREVEGAMRDFLHVSMDRDARSLGFLDEVRRSARSVSRLPEATIREDLQQLREADRLTPELVFRDPYLLDFLGLKDAFSERDLEAAILQELERFLLELGTDFAFLARQKRMTIGNQDFYLDLLFYHRRLARLIAIDLKLGRFEAGYKGQMELYLRWLDQNERRTEHEDAPLGLILCSAKDEEQIELLQLNQGEIRVAEYLTALPAKNILAAKLHDAVIRVREQLTRRERKPDEE